MIAKLGKKKLLTAFLDLTAAYDSFQREKLWAHLQNIHVPMYLLSTIRALYQDSVYILVDGDKVSQEIMATQGLKQGCPLSPLLYALFTNSLGKGRYEGQMCSFHCFRIFSNSSCVMVSSLWPGKKLKSHPSTRMLSLLFHRTTGL